jgi:bifunctional N-acetylglucosamine-1-phosphate-uridyltransferase/glucosamine-1-phosphate-acetyltransferase GlmU-like protein
VVLVEVSSTLCVSIIGFYVNEFETAMRKAGANSVIMSGVEIGENATVGANSLVTDNIPPNEICAGSPAKFLKRV